MRWRRMKWQKMAVPGSGGSHEWFHGMTALPGGDVWAAGQFSNGSGTDTLTARLAGAVSGDLDGDGAVGFGDLLALLSAWGPCAPAPVDCPADFDQSGEVGLSDLLTLLANWS